MSVVYSETLPIASEPDMVTVRRRVRELATQPASSGGPDQAGHGGQ